MRKYVKIFIYLMIIVGLSLPAWGADEAMDSRTELAAAPAENDVVPLYDQTASAGRRITILNLMGALESAMTSFAIHVDNLPSTVALDTELIGGSWASPGAAIGTGTPVAITGTTFNSGQGATEIHAMDQDMETSNDVTFNKVTATNGFVSTAKPLPGIEMDVNSTLQETRDARIYAQATDSTNGTEDVDIHGEALNNGVETSRMHLDADGHNNFPGADMNIDSGKVYRINGTQIDSGDLSDEASIAMLDEGETITGNWINEAHPWADNETANAQTIDAQAGSTWDIADSVNTTSVFSGGTSLEETTAADDSGASIIGVFDEFANSNSTNVQDVLDDLDAAMSAGGETNTASSQGSGTSLYYQKAGVDLQFNAIESKTDDITVGLNATSHNIGFTFNPGNVASTELSDGANVAHINANESVSGNWTFDGSGSDKIKLPTDNNPTVNALGYMAYDGNDGGVATNSTECGAVVLVRMEKQVYGPFVMHEPDQLDSTTEPGAGVWPVMDFRQEEFPGGFEITSIVIDSSVGCTDVVNMEEWSNNGTAWSSDSTVDAFTLSGTRTEETTITDATMAADSTLMADLNATMSDIDWLKFTVVGYRLTHN